MEKALKKLGFQGKEKHKFCIFDVCSIRHKNNKNYGKTLLQAGRRLKRYVSDRQHIFATKTSSVAQKAEEYIKSLWISRLTNIERMNETGIPENYHNLHHFISDSPWDGFKLMDSVSKEVNDCLPNQKLTGLHFDESGVAKKGTQSVGVSPQYCGNLGKVDNCQVAVYASLNNSDFASLVDSRLYLPQKWISDNKRCDKAKIPVEHRKFKTKQELALDMLRHQIELGVTFDYIGVDALYGADQHFTDTLDEMALPFVGDIRSNQKVFLKEPEIEIPQRKSNKGRRPTKLKADIEPIDVHTYMKSLTRKNWQEIKVRNTAKGTLKGLYHFCTVYIWDEKSHHVSKRLLIIRKSLNQKKPEIKYALSNVSLVQYEKQAIAYMQAQRFFIEHSFKEAKSVLGLDQYQTRKWIAWYHQVALNMLLLLFILKEKLSNFYQMPLLSAWDIHQLLVVVFASAIQPEDILTLILERHKIRQK